MAVAGACAAALTLGALAGCRTSQPSNSAPAKAAAPVERTDEDMKPERLLAGCVGLKSGGSYSTEGGSERKAVTFFLERDSKDGTIRLLQDMMGTLDMTLIEKTPHVTLEPESGANSLWMNLAQANGAPDCQLILDGSSIITSDKATDWHWSGGSRATFFRVVEALAPSSTEQHEELIKTASVGDGGAARQE